MDARGFLTNGIAMLVAGTMLAATPVHAQPATTTATATTAPVNIEARRKVLLTRMMADPSDLDIAFEYAALSSQAGDLEGAISTLERMLIFAPGLPRLQLELGVLYYRLGANEPALSYFNGALAAPDVPPDVRDKVEQYISAIEKRSETSGMGGAIMFGARYQTNANSAPSNSRIMLNNLPFTLSADSLGAPDANAFISGSFRAVHDLQSQGDQLVATLQVYGALYKEIGRLNTGVVEVTAGPSFDLRRFNIEDARLDIYAIASGVLLGNDPYLASGGVGVRVSKGLGADTNLRVDLRAVRNNYINSASRPIATNSNGYTVNGSVGVDHQLTENLKVFGLLSGERRMAERGYLTAWQGGITLGSVLTFASPISTEAGDWSLTVSGSFIKRVYDAPDPVINATTAQVDDEVFVQAALSVPLKDGWSIETSTSYRNVMSNYDLARSENVSVSLAAMKKF